MLHIFKSANSIVIVNTKKVVGWIELVEDPLQLEGEQHNSAKPVVDESALVHPLGGELVEGSPHGRRWEDVAPTGQQPRVEQSAQHARTEKLVIHFCIRVERDYTLLSKVIRAK